MKLLSWIRTWLSGLLFLAAIATGAWLFAQQTPSYRQMADLVRTHPAVAEQIGSVTDIKLPFFGWGIDWTDGQLNPSYNVTAIGSKGQAAIRSEFRDGKMHNAWMTTSSGIPVPLLVQQ